MSATTVRFPHGKHFQFAVGNFVLQSALIRMPSMSAIKEWPTRKALTAEYAVSVCL